MTFQELQPNVIAIISNEKATRDEKLLSICQLLNENTDHFIEQTVGHEWAHLAAANLHGHKIRSHGPEWKAVMHKLGLDAARCHAYTTQKARTVKPKSASRSRVSTKARTPIKSTGVPVLPPKTKIVAPPAVIIEIRIPGGVPASTVMWSYATRLASKKNITLPDGLQSNQAMLMQWIEMVRAR